MEKDYYGFIYSGRPKIEEKGFWKKFFCFHSAKKGQPERVHYLYSDIVHVQCENCGKWHYKKTESNSLNIMKAMFTADNRYTFKNELPGIKVTNNYSEIQKEIDKLKEEK